jgi:hypothetical protein
VDDLLIIFDQNKINSDALHNFINNTDGHLEFKITGEKNNTIHYLDLSISRNTNSIDLNIYRKPKYMDITVHFTSNNPQNHKLAFFVFYINRMISMRITVQAIRRELHKILIMAQNNGFPRRIIQQLREKLVAKKDRPVQTQNLQQQNNKWITFTYHDPSVHKITNLFNRTNMKITFRPTNTIYQQLSQNPKINNPSGTYQLKRNMQ